MLVDSSLIAVVQLEEVAIIHSFYSLSSKFDDNSNMHESFVWLAYVVHQALGDVVTVIVGMVGAGARLLDSKGVV